jgi:probable rRNA maturation factor
MADDGHRRRLQVEVVTGGGVRAPGLAAWLASVAPARARGDVTVALVTDARIRALNREYRKKDKATDVLSFPDDGAAEEGHHERGTGPAKAGHYDRRGQDPYVVSAFRRTGDASRRTGDPFRRPCYLGDIVIAAGVARRQARAAGHGLQTELRVLALHGLLHLLGYDHEHDEGRMARLERRLRLKGGLREGLIERASPRRGVRR